MAARVLAVCDVGGNDAGAFARAVCAVVQRLRARHRVRDPARTRRRRTTATAPLDAPRDAGSTKSNDVPEAVESDTKEEASSSENNVLVNCVFVDVAQGVVLSRNPRRDFVEWTSTFEEEVAADAVAAWDARHARDEVSRPMEPAAGLELVLRSLLYLTTWKGDDFHDSAETGSEPPGVSTPDVYNHVYVLASLPRSVADELRFCTATPVALQAITDLWASGHEDGWMGTAERWRDVFVGPTARLRKLLVAHAVALHWIDTAALGRAAWLHTPPLDGIVHLSSLNPELQLEASSELVRQIVQACGGTVSSLEAVLFGPELAAANTSPLTHVQMHREPVPHTVTATLVLPGLVPFVSQAAQLVLTEAFGRPKARVPGTAGQQLRVQGRVSLAATLASVVGTPAGTTALWRAQLASAAAADARRGGWAAMLAALAHAENALWLASMTDRRRAWLLWPLSLAEAWLLQIEHTGGPPWSEPGRDAALDAIAALGSVTIDRRATVAPLTSVLDRTTPFAGLDPAVHMWRLPSAPVRAPVPPARGAFVAVEAALRVEVYNEQLAASVVTVEEETAMENEDTQGLSDAELDAVVADRLTRLNKMALEGIEARISQLPNKLKELNAQTARLMAAIVRVFPQTLFRTLEDLTQELEPARRQRMAQLALHSFTSDPIGRNSDNDDDDDTDSGAKASTQAGTLDELDRATKLLIRHLQLQVIARLEYIRAVLVEQGKSGVLRIPDLAPLLEADTDMDESDSSIPDGPVNQDALDRVGLHAVRFLERLMLRVSNVAEFIAFMDLVIAQGFVCLFVPSTYKHDLLPLLRQITDVFEIEIKSLALDKPHTEESFAPPLALARSHSVGSDGPARGAPKAGIEGSADAARPQSKAQRVHKETNRAGFAVAKPIPHAARPGSPTSSTSSMALLPPQKRTLGRSQMRIRGPMRALAPSAAPSKAAAAAGPSILVMETPVAKPNKRKQPSDGGGPGAARPDRDTGASRLRRKLF